MNEKSLLESSGFLRPQRGKLIYLSINAKKFQKARISFLETHETETAP